MEKILEYYASYIINFALHLKKGDILSINTEEENIDFASKVALLASKVTKKGTYIQIIQNGKVISSDEVGSDFPINARPTSLLHLTSIKRYPILKSSELNAKELQEFSLLSEPLDNPLPIIIYAKAPVPSLSWAKQIDQNNNIEDCYSLINSLLHLNEDFISIAQVNFEKINSNLFRINDLNLTSGRFEDIDGTNLTFDFLKESVFSTTSMKTKDDRLFFPSLFSSSLFRAINQKTLKGKLSIKRPINLFGKIVKDLTLTFDNGEVIKAESIEKESENLLSIFFNQDKSAKHASMVSLNSITSDASKINYFSYSDWDLERTSSVILGGPKPEGIIDSELANYSLVTLNLPIGSKTLNFYGNTDKKSNIKIIENGSFII